MCLVGFASIAIVVVCGRCVLHRLFATTCKHPCLKPLGTHAKASLPLYERSVGFASLQSLWVFISGVLALLAPPVASTLSISTTFAKEHLSLALLAPPVAPNTSIPTTIAKPHYPSPRTTFLPYERSVGFASMPRQPFVPLHLCIDSHLCRCICASTAICAVASVQRLCVADFKHPCLKLWAFNFGHPCPSLVKGEVLSPTKIRATTGGIAFRRTEPLHSHNHCKRTTIPLPCTITLASTRKRVRFCCSVKPSQLWWGLLPICTINEIFRTIPLAFRRGAGLPLPSHRTSPFPQPL